MHRRLLSFLSGNGNGVFSHEPKSSALKLTCQVFGTPSEATPPVLILHGMLGSSNNWRYLGGKIAAELDTAVYAVDARNHGSSICHEEMNYKLMCMDMKGFCEQHNLEKVSILGHSMGGKTGMLMALDAPELVDSLVVVDVAPRSAPGQGTENVVQVLKDLDIRTLKNRNEADELLKDRIPSSTIRNFLLLSLVPVNSRAFQRSGTRLRWRFNLDGIAKNMHHLKDFPETDAVFEGPTLFLGGAKSNYITEETSGEIKKLFPTAHIQHIPDAGHWVHYEKPNEFLAAVVNFFKSRQSS